MKIDFVYNVYNIDRLTGIETLSSFNKGLLENRPHTMKRKEGLPKPPRM